MPNKVHVEGRPVWAEVNLGALTHNLRMIQRHVGSGKSSAAKSPAPKILAIVKANAYGHGAVPVARALAKAGADWFGVTCSAEAIELREGGVRKPVLLLSGFWEGEEKRIIQEGLTPAVTRSEQLWLLERAAAKLRSKPVSFHLKIDTGMNRLGISPNEVESLATTLAACPHLRLQGIFTHFASSEEFTTEKTDEQRRTFEATLAKLLELKIAAPLVHMANSAAIVCRPETWANMVRPGLILYGHHQRYDPPQRDAAAAEIMPLRPVLSVRARIISLRELSAGQGVGYNSRWTASKPSRVAVIAMGYADGLPRALTNKGRVIVRGMFAPLVGTISMDLSAVDVTAVPDTRVGDVVTIYGSDGHASQQVSDVAKILGTVTSDLCCELGMRVPRIYLP
jgi:alanine racemase